MVEVLPGPTGLLMTAQAGAVSLAAMDSISSRDGFCLGIGDVHLWILPLRVTEPDFVFLRATLSEDESLRAKSYLFDELRRDFECCRGLLRYLLGKYGGLDPSEVRFKYGEAGKPEVADRLLRQPLHFNVSHSGGWTLMAFASAGRVGVDVERFRHFANMLEIAESTFSNVEFRRLNDRPIGQQADCFFSIWTMKEAVLKALGIGIGQGMDHFDVPDHVAKEGGSHLGSHLVSVRGQHGTVQNLSVGRFRTVCGLYGAVCLDQARSSMSVFSHSGVTFDDVSFAGAIHT